MILTPDAHLATPPTGGPREPDAAVRARRRVAAWLAHPETAGQIEHARLEHAAAQGIARQLGVELSSWAEWLLCIIDWPRAAIHTLATQARAEGDAAAAEVLLAVGDASIDFDAFMQLPPQP